MEREELLTTEEFVWTVGRVGTRGKVLANTVKTYSPQKFPTIEESKDVALGVISVATLEKSLKRLTSKFINAKRNYRSMKSLQDYKPEYNLQSHIRAWKVAVKNFEESTQKLKDIITEAKNKGDIYVEFRNEKENLNLLNFLQNNIILNKDKMRVSVCYIDGKSIMIGLINSILPNNIRNKVLTQRGSNLTHSDICNIFDEYPFEYDGYLATDILPQLYFEDFKTVITKTLPKRYQALSQEVNCLDILYDNLDDYRQFVHRTLDLESVIINDLIKHYVITQASTESVGGDIYYENVNFCVEPITLEIRIASKTTLEPIATAKVILECTHGSKL